MNDPNPERVFRLLIALLEEQEQVKINYELLKNKKADIKMDGISIKVER